jgi:peptidoglycan-N-acetylglucosamine deacetylase
MNILTFDVEEWFHILDNTSTKTQNEWNQYESRIHSNMEKIFSILQKYDVKATFFCLGWIAKMHPDIIKKIVSNGYEIGTHSQMHQLVFEQTPSDFEKDLDYSIKLLQDITGKEIKYYRAPGFSIREDTKWAIEIIAKHGIDIDCSIFASKRAHGGFPSFSQPYPSIIKYNGISLKELPINTASLLGKSIIFSGGGYFRITPYSLLKYWTKNSEYVMTYLHPRDFDPHQPILKDLNVLRLIKSYVGLESSIEKFEHWLNDFRFCDIETAVTLIDWSTVPVVEL